MKWRHTPLCAGVRDLFYVVAKPNLSHDLRDKLEQ